MDLNDPDVAEKWDIFFSELEQFLCSLSRRESTVDPSFLRLTCHRLDHALSVVAFLSNEFALVDSNHDGGNNVTVVLAMLLRNLREVRLCWQDKAYHANDVLLEQTYSVSAEQSGNVGRPSFNVDQDQVDALRELGFSWTSIACLLGISRATLYRRLSMWGNDSSRAAYTDISDDDLDARVLLLVRQCPEWGERLLAGALIGQGVRVQRRRLRASIDRVDPVSRRLRWQQPIRRRPYSVPCPNSLWHIDSYMKLVRWGFVVHGGVDGFSRLIVFMSCSTNNRASTVLEQFTFATAQYGLPSRVRADHGGENNDVERFMKAQRGEGRGSMLRGSSVHNQRIERLWRDLWGHVAVLFYRLFYWLEGQHLLDLNNQCDLLALKFVYLPQINTFLSDFRTAWNKHSIRTAAAKSPEQLYVAGLLSNVNAGHTSMDVLQYDPSVIASSFGIDWDGPIAYGHDDVDIPVELRDLSQEEKDHMKDLIEQHGDVDYSVRSYRSCRQYLHQR